ncbi:hypothetical protein HU200_002019 [Digitaria exilis]|uniref:RRM domain-containing protein n=1 Tax=Digitaria exilis TaxID=1010633 RepID=A0A835KUB8_9POAL|nr:hypothetical protein HU200_002019 [Digitaria exilis]
MHGPDKVLDSVRHAADRRRLHGAATSLAVQPSAAIPAAGASASAGSGSPEEAPGLADPTQGHHPHPSSSPTRPRRRRRLGGPSPHPSAGGHGLSLARGQENHFASVPSRRKTLFSAARAAEKPSSSRPPPPADEENPSSPPPSASKIPSSPPPPRPPTDAAAGNRAPTRKVRKVITKGTIATRKAAAAVGAASAAAGVLQPGEVHGMDEPPTDRNAAGDEMVVKEQNLGGTAIKEPAAGCNAVPVCESFLGKEVVMEGTVADDLVMDCGDAPEVEKLASRGEVGMSDGQRRRITEAFVGGLNRDTMEKDMVSAYSEAGEITKVRMSEGQRRRMTEVFVGGLNRDATEEDVRAVLAEAGEITEVRMVMDAGTKNRGYCFVRYREAAQARKAIAEFGNVKVVLYPLGLIHCCNRGFAFLELETFRDAQIAYKKLSRKDVFGKEGVPNSWDQAKMKEIFKKYGKIELVVLSRDLRMTKRNGVAFITYATREAAILCLESFDGEQLTENGSKVNIKVALAKSATKGKKNMDKKCCIIEKETTKIPKSERKLELSSPHILPSSSRVVQITGNKKSSTTNGLLHVLKELAPWRHGLDSDENTTLDTFNQGINNVELGSAGFII